MSAGWWWFGGSLAYAAVIWVILRFMQNATRLEP